MASGVGAPGGSSTLYKVSRSTGSRPAARMSRRISDVVNEGWEGCLSIPDVRGLVPRATTVRVEAYDRMGKRISFTANGLTARVIQHETDHLDGVLFMDRMRSLASLAFMDEHRRFWTEDEDDEE